MQPQSRAVHALAVALVVMVLGTTAVFWARRSSNDSGKQGGADVPLAPTLATSREGLAAPIDVQVKPVALAGLVDSEAIKGPVEVANPPVMANANDAPSLATPPETPTPPQPADESPEEALAQAHSTLVPEPAAAAEAFLAKSRTEAEQAIAALQAERETLASRMQKVESGLARWQAVLEALKVQAHVIEPAAKPAPEPGILPPVISTPEKAAENPAELEPIAPETKKTP
jgi:hypothetical protein